MQHRYAEVSGFVLAGGASRRMGQPKHNLRLAGETMLGRQVRLLRRVCRRVAILAPPENVMAPGVPVFGDVIPGRGPLGGIYTGLLLTRTEYNLFLSCDLPLIRPSFLQYLCGRAIATAADITVPQCGPGGYQPLCAVYRRRSRGAIRASLLKGENKTTRFFRYVRRHAIGWRDLAAGGFPPLIFMNMNTPADYEAAKQQFHALDPHPPLHGPLAPARAGEKRG